MYRGIAGGFNTTDNPCVNYCKGLIVEQLYLKFVRRCIGSRRVVLIDFDGERGVSTFYIGNAETNVLFVVAFNVAFANAKRTVKRSGNSRTR